jgi:hypothetical protein
MFNWFSAKTSENFGKDLAAFVLSELSTGAGRRDAKFTAKAEKALVRADQRVRDFKASERLNVYKKAKLANAFLWKLRDSGCSAEYADQLTEWLSLRL